MNPVEGNEPLGKLSGLQSWAGPKLLFVAGIDYAQEMIPMVGALSRG